ncbi:MAG: NAD(P)H-hydrate epimerase, partial [Anaerolineae bacterium]|nr:NAD(P)H-hydrate epimerase [Anaerolineae bacterium]
MYIVSTQQMQAAEKAANASGLSYDTMMENAGQAVAQAIERYVDISGGRVLVLVGPGNNGGDGLVVARYLAQSGVTVAVYIWKRNTEDDPNWSRLDQTSVECIWGDDASSQTRLGQLLDESDLIVDALLGTGVSRPIEGTLAELLDQTKA